MSMPRIAFLPVSILILITTACGQKGPLILPDAKTSAPVSKIPVPAPPIDKDKKDKNRSE